MRWYGALQEGPKGVYTIMVTNFENGISGGQIADEQPDHVAQFLGFIDRLIANGDEITLVADRYQRLFRRTDQPTLWRTLVEKYASDYYTATPYHDDQTYYEISPDNGARYFDAPVCIVLVRPGSFIATHRYLTDGSGAPDTADCAHVGSRAATDPALLLVLRANTHVPSSQDVFHTLVDGDGSDFAGYVGGPDVWATVRNSASVKNPDVAEFHLQYAETVSQFQDLGDGIAHIFAVLKSCERYRLGLKVGGPTARRSSTPRTESPPLLWLTLPIELPEVPENLVQAWMS